VPDDFGSWKTLWKRHDRWSGDGTWDRLLTEMCADADAVAELDWLVAVDSSINRAHQHAAGARRITDPTATRHRVGRVGRVAYRRPDPRGR
jgi:transposase